MKPFVFWLLSPALALATLTIQDTGTATATVRSFGPTDLDLPNGVSVTDIPVPQSGGGSTSNSTLAGRVYVVTTGDSVKHNKQLAAPFTGRYAPTVSASWSSSNTAVATVNASGYATHLTDGAATFSCATPYGTWSTLVNFATTAASVSVFSNWSSGLLPADMNAEVDSLISAAGTFSSNAQNLYSSANDTTGTYVRNTGVWTGSVNLTAIPTWSSAQYTGNGGVVGYLGTLITPTDVLVANHVAPNSGTTYRFTDNSNNTYTATIGSTVNVSGDLSVAHIASWSSGSKPSTVSVMPVLPSNYQHYCPDYNLNYFPVIGTNQYRQVAVRDSTQNSATSSSFYLGALYYNTATETNRAPWTLNIVTGDSSEPCMAVVNGQAVLICATYTRIYSPDTGDNIAGINSALATLDAGGTVYTVTTPNLSSFTATTNNGNVTSFPTY